MPHEICSGQAEGRQPRSDVDGSVVTWGDQEWGGDSSKAQRQLIKGAVQARPTLSRS